MNVERLNVNGGMAPHTIVPIIGDGACLFRAISFVLYENQVMAREIREEIVAHVATHWEYFSIMSHDADGNNYNNSDEYIADMSVFHTYGGLCELVAAGQIFPIVFEVYRNGELYEKFGTEGNPVKRLRFSAKQDLSNGHFDVYLPYDGSVTSDHQSDNSDILHISNKNPKKRRARFTNATRTKQLKKAATKYQQNKPEVHRAAAFNYQQKNPEVHRTAVINYQQNHPQVHTTAVMNYHKNHPEVRRAAVCRYEDKNPKRQSQRRVLAWKNKAFSGMTYDSRLAYENDKSVLLGTMSHKCVNCNALKFKEEAPGMCCSAGKVQLPAILPLPEPLDSLLMGQHPEHKHFMDRIRQYNQCFQMTSFGAKQIIEDGFMPTFKVQGQVYHLIGSLDPLPQFNPQFLQIYFVGEDEREASLRCNNFPNVKQSLVKHLQTMLHHYNPYIKDLKTTLEKVPQNCDNFEIVIHADRKPPNAHRGCFNAPTASEVALVIVGQQFEKRDIILQSHDNKLQHVSELHRSYDALQYPLLFCRGENGYSIDVSQTDPKTKLPIQKTVSAMNFYAYRIMVRQTEVNHLLYCRSLFNQYLVDMYAKIETERLNFIRSNQAKLRADNYINLKDAIGRQDVDVAQLGQMVVLPSSFTGSQRYMHEKTQDAMTYVRHYGRPDLFITFTCNPRWKDIADALLYGQKPHDRHDIIARVFHLKVKALIALLTKGNLFGEVRCFIYSVEWQKRGLPHIHILLWLQQHISPDKLDNVICAEIPDPTEDPFLYEIIKGNMIHGPCGNLNNASPCMKAGYCTKKFPRPLLQETQTGEDGYPKYRRRSPEHGGFTVKINGVILDNRWVVPFNPVLSRTFGAHINVEYCNSVKSIKYICKYINKGSDQATFGIENRKDEVKLYECGRYISSSEAVWRILGFPIHERFPAVFHLAVHLENGQRIYFNPKETNHLTDVVMNPPKTTLLAFFELCKIDKFAKTLLYVEVPSYYVWKNNRFERRKRGIDVNGWPGVKKDSTLGRVYTIHPNNTECYYLRLLLHEIRGPTSFEEIKTVNGRSQPTYQLVCKVLGLLEDDKNWDATMEEVALCDSPFRLRELFSVMLIFCQLSDAFSLWEKYKDSLSEDIRHRVELELQHDDVHLIIHEVYNKCLVCIEDTILSLGGQCLQQYGLPQPQRCEAILQNRDYLREISYDPDVLAQIVTTNERTLNDEQSNVYIQILESIEKNIGQIFFLDAPGGTGKTFLINLLLYRVRKERGIALAVASSGIAATLLEGGKTAHSAFKLPLNLTRIETPMCNISKQSNMAQVLKECKLIVWDECTMAHKGGFEAVNRILKDIRGNDSIMGGVTVLLAGDFRQTLPVVPRGTRADEVKSSFKNSYLWPHIRKLALHKNMRVHLRGDVSDGLFAEILLKIGDGNFPLLEGKMTIPIDLATVVTSLSELISKIYPDISSINEKPIEWLCERAILTPKNDRAAVINNLLLTAFTEQDVEYRSFDSMIQIEDAVHYPTEFLNSLNPSGLPSHRLKLKIGAPVMLLRNLNPPKLCNGTRLKIKALHKNVIEATVITGFARGEVVFIPRIPLIPSEYPFEFKRIQFPLKVCFAMTINKSQGQTLKMAGIDLSEDCFSHGQFYVACSRVSSASSLVILAPKGNTANVVYKEVLR